MGKGKEMEKVITYYRTSTKTNEQGDSKTRQREICLNFCKSQKFEVVSETYDVITGTLPITEREKFLEMIEFARENGITKIIFSDWSRFARSILAQEYSLQYLNRKGFECISATNGKIEDNETDTLMRNIMGSIFQFEKDCLVKKLRVARERVRKVKGKCEGRKSIKEENPEMVKLAKKLRRKNPKTKRVRSYETISKILFDLGHKNTKGERYASKVVMDMCK